MINELVLKRKEDCDFFLSFRVNWHFIDPLQTQRLSPALIPSFDLFPSDAGLSTVPVMPTVPRDPVKSLDLFPSDPDLSIISERFAKKSLDLCPRSSLAARRSGSDSNWVLLGEAEVVGFSTCKGPKLQVGDSLQFNFPKPASAADIRRGPWGRGKGATAAAEIVRFSCQRSGEVMFFSPTRIFLPLHRF